MSRPEERQAAAEQGGREERQPADPGLGYQRRSEERLPALAAREHAGRCLALIDDRLARREAQAAGLKVAGTAAVVATAQTRGLIPSARQVFERLLRSDFRISPGVIRGALDRVES